MHNQYRTNVLLRRISVTQRAYRYDSDFVGARTVRIRLVQLVQLGSLHSHVLTAVRVERFIGLNVRRPTSVVSTRVVTATIFSLIHCARPTGSDARACTLGLWPYLSEAPRSHYATALATAFATALSAASQPDRLRNLPATRQTRLAFGAKNRVTLYTLLNNSSSNPFRSPRVEV